MTTTLRLSGILLLDKPAGLSSNAALQRVRRTLGVDKAGHVGSLDPLATGMLPICLGEATKIAGDVLSGRKCYRFRIGLGARTATGDTEGAVVETAVVPTLDATTLEAARQRFLGRQTQVPPMYSALKRDGQPLYKLARAGVEVERAAREIELFDLQLLTSTVGSPSPPGIPSLAARSENPWASLEFETLCSKGTYIRVLAEDIAKALGTVGHVTMLRRVHVEPFETEPMETLESVIQAREQGTLPRVLPADWPLGHLPKVSLTAAQAARLMQGQAVSIGADWSRGTGAAAAVTSPAGSGDVPSGDSINAAVGVAERVRLYDETGRFLGIGATDEYGTVRPRRLFTQ